MRQKNTDPFRSGQRRDARRGVALHILLQLLSAGLLLWVRRYILWRWLDLLLLLMAVVPLLIAGSDAGIGQPLEAGYGCNTDKGKFVCRKEKENYGSDIE